MNCCGTKSQTPETRFATAEERWVAVVDRDRAADGQFFYSVKTTGVYCRPSCASRLARRENVSFFASADAAEAAGFRACKRCKPDGIALGAKYSELVERACQMLGSADESCDLASLARGAGMSQSHFHRIFKEVTGLTPKRFSSAIRAEQMRNLLSHSESVTQAIYQSGFNSNSRFYEKSSTMLGMRPTEFREGGARTQIRFAVGECSLGSVLVAATWKGVCAIFLGDNPDELARNLQDRFPRAELIGGEPEFEKIVSHVIGVVDKPISEFKLPLDVQGTAFQQKVWDALRGIPVGKTATYTEIAAKIGNPKSFRAVAQACGANPVAVVVPCHRVIRTDGNLSGYRWGVERKRQLLAKERS